MADPVQDKTKAKGFQIGFRSALGMGDMTQSPNYPSDKYSTEAERMAAQRKKEAMVTPSSGPSDVSMLPPDMQDALKKQSPTMAMAGLATTAKKLGYQPADIEKMIAMFGRANDQDYQTSLQTFQNDMKLSQRGGGQYAGLLD